MCIGGSKSSNTTPPAPSPPTTFDYSSANRAQSNADGAVSRAQAAKQLSTTAVPDTGASFGSGLAAT